MSKQVIHEDNVETLDMPGRALKWMVTPDSGVAENLSFNVVKIDPGETVRPAHSHPKHEELIYIMSGCGEVYIDGEISKINAGTAVVFPTASVHQVRNSSDEEMKIACFFSPSATFDDYIFHEGMGFPPEEDQTHH